MVEATRAALSNTHLELVLDERGIPALLRNAHTGADYVELPGQDFWQIIYPHDDDSETPVRSRDQLPAQIAAESDRVSVRYPFLLDCANRRLEIDFRYTILLRSDELVLIAELRNASPATVTELWFPMLGGLRGLGGRQESAFLLYPESAGRRVADPVRTLSDRAQPVRGARLTWLREFYPGKASTQWMGLYGSRGSLYLASHDTSLQTTAVNASAISGTCASEDSLSLGFIKYPFCQPGQSWRSEPFVIAVHAESWHFDARRYRAFADTWQDHRRTKPDWVQDMPALHDIVMLHQHGRVRLRYDQITELCDAAATAGIDAIKLTGWAAGGHDNMVPDFLPSDRLGGEAGLVQCLRTAQTRGFRCVLYFHFVQMSPNSAFYARHGEFCQLKGPRGNPFIDVFTWPSNGTILAMNERMQLINACVATEPWQQHVLQCVRRGLRYGADCIFLDQTAGAPGSFMCFDTRHRHPTPALASGPGKACLSSLPRDIVKAAPGDKALGAEYLADAILQYYDFTIPFGSGFFYEGQHFGEMFRYTFPEDVILTQYISREDYAQLAYSFVMGYRFFLAPLQQCELVTALRPEFVRRLASLIRLRRRHAGLLMRGRFLDTLPLDTPDSPIVARAFQHPDGSAAAAAWNPTAQPQPLSVQWHGKQPTAIHTPASDLRPGASLPPGEVAVLLF